LAPHYQTIFGTVDRRRVGTRKADIDAGCSE
jgi:hypothetical protein